MSPKEMAKYRWEVCYFFYDEEREGTRREELRDFARLTGKNDVHQLSTGDLFTTHWEISSYSHIEHV